jgi:hypothetical protein
MNACLGTLSGLLAGLPLGRTGALVLGVALCAVVNALANRAADRERARRAAVDGLRTAEMRGQAVMREERLLALNDQLTRQ